MQKLIDVLKILLTEPRDSVDFQLVVVIAMLSQKGGVTWTEIRAQMPDLPEQEDGWADRLIDEGFICCHTWEEDGLFLIDTPALKEPMYFGDFCAFYSRKEDQEHARSVYNGVVRDLSLQVFHEHADPIRAAEDHVFARLNDWLDAKRSLPKAAEWLIRHTDVESRRS